MMDGSIITLESMVNLSHGQWRCYSYYCSLRSKPI